MAIIRVQYNKTGQVAKVMIKKSSGDPDFDKRGMEFIQNSSHPPLHQNGKNKGLRQSQWYEVRYTE